MRSKSPVNNLVSVIIPTYNCATHLGDAIKSILSQTYPVHEVIVVDDGSTDNTETTIEQFKKCPSVRYIYKCNGGHASARNLGVRNASGDLIGFNDADDIWKPDKLSKQIPLFESRPRLGVVYSDREWIDEHGNLIPTRKVRRHRGSHLFNKLLYENFVPMSTPIVRRSIYNHVGGFNEKLLRAPDLEFWLKVSLSYDFDFVDEPLALHRKWSGQLTQDKQSGATACCDIIEQFIIDNTELVDKQTINTSRFNCCMRMGRAAAHSGRRYESLKWFWKAFIRQPWDLSVCKSILKACICFK